MPTKLSMYARETIHESERKRDGKRDRERTPDYSASHSVPPVSSPSSPPVLPFPLYYHPRALSSSHHGRRTAVRELLLFVGRRPAQAAGFSMISNPFRCTYARNRPEPTARAETKSVRLTEFQRRRWKLGTAISIRTITAMPADRRYFSRDVSILHAARLLINDNIDAAYRASYAHKRSFSTKVGQLICDKPSTWAVASSAFLGVTGRPENHAAR